VELVVRDDGRGFDPDEVPSGHLGLAIMHERAESVGALLDIDSEPGRGTTVVLRYARPMGAT
jgi:signal transduction histidine kinase